MKRAGWGIFNIDAEDNELAVPRVLEKLQGKLESIMKGEYEHFMQKEIFEQPESIQATLLGRVKRVCCQIWKLHRLPSGCEYGSWGKLASRGHLKYQFSI
jgi:glucosamine 6-phosphate synthetase-like amidotransferase/phosphosugar isomerase protein